MKIAMITQDSKVYYFRYFFGLLKPKLTERSICSRLDLVSVQMPRAPEHKFFQKRKEKYEKKLEQLLREQKVEKTYIEETGASQRFLSKHFKEALLKVAKLYKIPLESADIALVCTNTNNQALQQVIDDICLLTRFAVLLTGDIDKGEMFSSKIYDSCGYPLFVSRPTASREDFDIAVLFEQTDIKIRGKVTFNLTGQELMPAEQCFIINSLVIQSEEVERLKEAGISQEIIYQICLDCGLEEVKIIDFQ